MADARIMLDTVNGGKLWINAYQVVKMELTADGRYFVYTITGEVFEVDKREARRFEEFLED